VVEPPEPLGKARGCIATASFFLSVTTQGNLSTMSIKSLATGAAAVVLGMIAYEKFVRGKI
jgi:hypothetical protein